MCRKATFALFQELLVFRVGFFFFVWLRFCQGAVAPSRFLRAAGLQLRILNGVVSLLTTRVENKALAAYVSEQTGASGNLQMTAAS